MKISRNYKEELNLLEARMQSQRSRVLWRSKGDRNTKYFHSYVQTPHFVLFTTRAPFPKDNNTRRPKFDLGLILVNFQLEGCFGKKISRKTPKYVHAYLSIRSHALSMHAYIKHAHGYLVYGIHIGFQNTSKKSFWT